MQGKKIVFPLAIFLLISVLLTLPLKAQVTIGDTKAPENFSLLELISSGKRGLRLPQLTTTQRNALEATLAFQNEKEGLAMGLQIFNTTSRCIETWDGEGWTSACCDPASLPTGSGTLTGRTVFDIARSNDNSTCGALIGRQLEQADFTKTAFNTQTYTFTPSGTVSNVRFSYVENVPGKIVESITPNNPSDATGTNISTACSVTLVYKESLNDDAYGLTSDNPLIVDIYAIYNTSGDGKGTEQTVKLTVIIKDCACCGAMTTDGKWLNFLCFNLGANVTLDPFSSVQGQTPGVNGAGGDGSDGTFGYLFQWGRTADGHQLLNSPTTTTLSLSDISGNGNFILSPTTRDWRSTKNDNLWGATKTANDPCPTGWRVPTEAEWASIYGSSDPNPATAVANKWQWINTTATGGFKIGDFLFLPAAGFRQCTDGSFYAVGVTGSYWSTTISSNDVTDVYDLYFGNTFAIPLTDGSRAHGMSVRCISEQN